MSASCRGSPRYRVPAADTVVQRLRVESEDPALSAFLEGSEAAGGIPPLPSLALVRVSSAAPLPPAVVNETGLLWDVNTSSQVLI